MKILIKLLIAGVTFVFLSSCQTTSNSHANSKSTVVAPCQKGSAQCCGKTRGTFLGDWFDYYERGLSYADCLMWDEAYNDLSTAISKRGKDKRRVYTLGMHFITNYFPHRELGVVLYNQGKYQQAQKHLLISLKQFPSTKAENFLNKTRIKLQSIIDNEKSAPSISLSSKAVWSNQKGRAVSLTITDDTFIEKVWIDNELYIWQDITLIDKTPVSIQRAKPLITLNKVITSNKPEIIITAQDIFGNKSIKKIENRVDVLQPKISIMSIEENEFGEVEVQGVISDHQSGIKWINIGEDAIELAGKNDFEFSFVAAGQTFNISAQDVAGNNLSITRAITFTKPLTIDLQSTSLVSTQENTWILSGWIESSNKIKYYAINNQKFSTNGTRLHISHELALKTGINYVKLSVQDASGQNVSQTIQVTRTVPHHLNNKERLLMALFPFSCDKNTGENCKNSLLNYQEMDEKVRARKRFQLVERATLSEQLDSLKICELMVTDKCAWQAAQLVKTQSMFVGEMIIRKSPNGASEEVYARIINTDDGSVLISFDAYLENSEEESINKQLYVKLHERFPLISTENLEINGNKIKAKFDSPFQFWKNMPVKLFSNDQACAQGLVVKQSSPQGIAQQSTAQIELNARCNDKGQKRLVTL
jgi:hypothetical protein